MNDGTQITKAEFGKDVLQLDEVVETERIVQGLQQAVHEILRHRGAVVGVSGGIDSSLVLALSVRAFGAEHVVGILMPEKESSAESAVLAQEVADCFGVSTVTEDLTPALEGFGCYRRRDEAISRVFPEYGPGWKAKIVLRGSPLEQEALHIFWLIVISPGGEEFSKRLPLAAYQQITAASNFKQRARMATLYYHAEQRNYAVVGTANKNEHELGFFVKYGDGGVDVQPIQHLYKSQVYQLARYLGVPETILSRTPTTDTYSAGGTQDEFFFQVPFQILDVIWQGRVSGFSDDEIAAALELTPLQVQRVADDLVHKQRVTTYLRSSALGIQDMNGGR